MRFFVDTALRGGMQLVLPEAADRHARVRRVQPGDAVVLFDGQGSDWRAEVQAVGRRDIDVLVQHAQPAAPEAAVAVRLAVVVPANERMDTVVEKATELGAVAVQPLLSERSVLRLHGERADRRRQHWQGIVRAASEQCGRGRLMAIEPVQELAPWLAALPSADDDSRWLLGFAADARMPAQQPRPRRLTSLSGPEGGLTPAEEALARQHGFVPVSLGPRVLRADTAPLALLAWGALVL
jgi:16S rRNA (uracil1498-N3)-methyltransferase